MPQSFFVQSSTVGVDLNNGNATALFAVGTHVLGTLGTEWVYVQANTSIVGNSMVAYNSGTFTCSMASSADAMSGMQLASAQTSISSQAFGWVCIRGVVTVLQTGTASVAGTWYVGGTVGLTGIISNQISATGTVLGINVFPLTNTATYANVIMTWPRYNTTGQG